MALDTPNIIVSLGQKDGLHFIFEEFEVKLHGRLAIGRRNEGHAGYKCGKGNKQFVAGDTRIH